MEKTVLFRDFEERDIDFIYKCKNDEKLNSLIVGEFKPFSYEDAVKWVHGCMGEHENYKFWAICTNNEEKRIVGWISLSNIDKSNLKACYHGLVIGDSEYNDGLAWIEAYLFIMEQAFFNYNLNRLYGTHITEHHTSSFSVDLFFWKKEGILREAIIKNERKFDLNYVSLLKSEYLEHLKNGDYQILNLIRRIRQLKK